jgi:hypothetical protein
MYFVLFLLVYYSLWECRLSFTPFLFTPTFSETQLGVKQGLGVIKNVPRYDVLSFSGVMTDSRSNGRTPQLVYMQPAPLIMQLA